MEIYNNQIDCNHVNGSVSGAQWRRELFHDNTITNCAERAHLATLSAFRMVARFSSGAAQTERMPGTRTSHGNPFYSGTAASSGKGSLLPFQEIQWTTNQWAGYTIKGQLGSSSRYSHTFRSNTANTINFRCRIHRIRNLTFAAGDSFEINKVDQARSTKRALDKATLLSGDHSHAAAELERSSD